MRGIVVSILLVSACIFSFQPAGTAGFTKVWIFFEDRPFLKGSGLHPAQITKFSRTSIERRQARAEVLFDQFDFPPDPAYVRAVRDAGATVLVESRWLNAVSAMCDESCFRRISSLVFVSEIRPVRTYKRRPEPIFEEVNIASSPGIPGALDYGLSREQLNQLNVLPVHKKGFAGQGEIVAIFDSGFRKDHVAFQDHVIVAERDFVFGDDDVSNGSSFDSHGTSTWSCVGGASSGQLFGPAFKASFLLAITEDIRSETQVEEDNWVAALEWADQNGASVINSSLGYPSFYTPLELDGKTAITTRAANTASKKGIVVANSAGNSGPGGSSLNPPADANKILTVGAIDFAGAIASFSSRGPTADGRIKPEVVARGVATFVATQISRQSFGRSSGTSFSSPLVAGCAATLLSAHPDWKPGQIREALMMTASQASSPDNTFGYGIVNLNAALDFLPKKSIVIEHKELKNTRNDTKPYRVVARIRAERGLDENKLFLFFREQGTSRFQRVEFSSIPDQEDKFEAFIPPQSKGTTIEYFLQASDAKGKRNRHPFPAPKSLLDFNVR